MQNYDIFFGFALRTIVKAIFEVSKEALYNLGIFGDFVFGILSTLNGTRINLSNLTKYNLQHIMWLTPWLYLNDNTEAKSINLNTQTKNLQKF